MATPPKDPVQVEIQKKFPEYAWAFDHPSLGPVLKTAISEEWDAQRVLSEIRETDWYKTTRPAQRVYEEKVKSDPAAIEQSIAQGQTKIWDYARQMGVNVGGDLIKQLATEQLMWGLTDDQIRDQISLRAQYQAGQTQADYAGTIGTTMGTIKNMARQYMVTIDDNTAFNWAKQVAANEQKVEDFGSVLGGWAKARFPSIAKEIDAGVMPDDYFSQHRQAIGQLLEQNPDTVNLLDPKWSQVIDTVDEQGNRRPMSYNETMKFARSQPEWRKTRNGQETAAKMTETILRTFGKVKS